MQPSKPSFATMDNNASFQEEETLSISHILHVFWLHRQMFVAVFVFITISASIVLFQLTPEYTSEAKILVGTAKAQVVDVKAVLSGDMSTDDAVKSEVEILTSRSLAKKVITRLDLLNHAEFNPKLKEKSFFSNLNPVNWIPDEFKEALGKKSEPLTEEEAEQQRLAKATDIYIKKLTASPVRGSQVIKITFKSTDPKLAAKIANTHGEIYIVDQLEAKFEATEKASAWLNDQLTELRIKVADSEKAVETYRSTHNLSRGVQGEGLLQGQLSEINSQLIIAKAARAEAGARLRQVENLLKNGADIETAPEVLSSPLIQSLRQQEAELTRKISEMAVEYGPKHPKMIRVKAEIADLQANIDAEIRKIAAGLRNEVNIASTREQSLQSSLAAIEYRSGSSQKDEVALRALEREANANRILFETFLNRFKETSSTQGMAEADARIISAAEVPQQASFPKKPLMLMLIVIMATVVSSAVVFLLEMLNPGLRSPEEVESLLGVPAIGLIPMINDRDAIDYILEKPNSSLAEAINSLRVSITLSSPDNDIKSVMISSSVPSEGKSTLVLCLARSAALSGLKVIIVDADLRRPTIEKKLGLLTKSKGLTDLIMSDEKNMDDFMFKDEKSNLYIMPKGHADYINATDVFSSHRMKKLIEAMKTRFDLIIFDLPPVMAVTDARILASLMDKTIYVVSWDKTPRKVIKAGLQQLVSANANIAGIVLQQVDLKQYGSFDYSNSGHFYHYGKYGQYYSN